MAFGRGGGEHSNGEGCSRLHQVQERSGKIGGTTSVARPAGLVYVSVSLVGVPPLGGSCFDRLKAELQPNASLLLAHLWIPQLAVGVEESRKDHSAACTFRHNRDCVL